jgi:LysM repeat protein
MENEQPELNARPRQSRTPLIIGIVVAIHVVLIGSAFVIQEIHKRQAPAADLAEMSPEGAPISEPVAMPPPAPEIAAAEPIAAAPEPIRAPEPVVVPVEKKAAPVVKHKLVTKTYTVKKGDTWKGVSTRLKVPVQQLARDNKLDSKKFLRIGQKLAYKQAVAVKPTQVAARKAEKPSVPKLAAGDSPVSNFVVYEVRKGDTLGAIATRHAMKLGDLRTVNELKNDKIVVGQKLKVQQPGPKPTIQSLVADVEPRESAPQIHVITKGETLSELARRYGVPTSELLKANNIDDPSKVPVGQRLKIPSLEFPGVRAEVQPASAEQETLIPTVEQTTRI